MSNIQVAILLDDSISMRAQHGGFASRLAAVKEAAMPIIEKACLLDPNGPTLISFGSQIHVEDGVTLERVAAVLNGIQANGTSTMTGKAVAKALEFVAQWNADGDQGLVVVFTDGAASDRDALIRNIEGYSNRMTADEQCAILFVSVGTDAIPFLTQLDDSLNGKFDIVDHKTLEEALALGVEELFDAAFNG